MSLTTDELVTEVEAVIEVEVEEQVSNAFTFWLFSLAAGTIAGIAVGLAVA